MKHLLIALCATTTLSMASGCSKKSSEPVAKAKGEAPDAKAPDAKVGLDAAVVRIGDKWALPDVGDAVLEPLSDGPVVIVTSTEVILFQAGIAEGVVAVTSAGIPREEKEGGAGGYRIARLAQMVRRLEKGDGGLQLALDPSTSFRVLFDVLYSTKDAYSRIEILARATDGLGSFPVTLPDKGKGPAATVKLVVQLSTTEATVWSVSGSEGTMKQPKLTVPIGDGAAAVQAALAEIVARRWADATEREPIVLMADDATTVQTLVTFIVAMRAAGLPDVLFSRGFQ